MNKRRQRPLQVSSKFHEINQQALQEMIEGHMICFRLIVEIPSAANTGKGKTINAIPT
ncbi:hypothetical protein HO173_010067 [Letharia columbiana]|uniref:Uncharacterized protein n=1 Tax=Letharia columbiana TaxID=112416 RepID=A0A8H6L174_9LECA|nr:uncharacterized protein HO173_010067 [Letharia columbiana]KAF6231765.1 hypothetical protein HO173_010067 [Letharia columbiana]